MSGLDLPDLLHLPTVHYDNIIVIIARNGQRLHILQQWKMRTLSNSAIVPLVLGIIVLKGRHTLIQKSQTCKS